MALRRPAPLHALCVCGRVCALHAREARLLQIRHPPRVRVQAGRESRGEARDVPDRLRGVQEVVRVAKGKGRSAGVDGRHVDELVQDGEFEFELDAVDGSLDGLLDDVQRGKFYGEEGDVEDDDDDVDGEELPHCAVATFAF